MRGHKLLGFVVLLALGSSAGDASAEPEREHWWQGPRGRHREIHLGVTIAGGTAYLISEFAAKSVLAPSECRWCNPTDYDQDIRDAVVWDDPSLATKMSSVTGFFLAPVTAVGLTMLASSSYSGNHWARWLDDVIPVLESGVLAGVLNQIVKFSVGEQRPAAHFAPPDRPPEVDDNTAFYSGHTTLAFALATSAGIVAHEREYPIEPVIWASGYTIAVATGYLRMAGDRHYFTDVMVGAILGTGVGIAVPLGLHGKVLTSHDVTVVPTTSGIAVAGVF